MHEALRDGRRRTHGVIYVTSDADHTVLEIVPTS
jgi:hypothetical protein